MQSLESIHGLHTRDSLRRSKRSGVTTVFVICGIGTVGFAAILWATARWGIGVAADSTVYITAARSLLSHGSLQDFDAFGRAVPLVHYPPLLPCVLAALGWLFHVDPLVAARWLSAGLFGINTMLLGLACWRILNSSALGITSALLALSFTPMVALHQMALSEPLYICFALGAFLLVLRQLDEPSTTGLVLAGIVTALAFLTRYAGIAVVLAGVLAFLFLQRKKFSIVIRDTLIYSALSCLPLGAWLLRNHIQAGSASDFFNGKSLNLGASMETVVAGMNTASTWLFPGAIPFILRIVASAGLVLGTAACSAYAVSRRQRHSDSDRLPLTAGIFVLCNLFVLLLTVLILDGTTPLDDRLLLPLFAPLAILLMWSLHRARDWGFGSIILPLVIIGLAFATNTVRSANHLWTTAHSGRGYSSRDWQASSVIAQLRSMKQVPIYATLPSAIRFLTQQPVRQLPNTFNPRTERRNENYEQEMTSLYRESKDSGIAIVYFNSSVNRWYPSEAELVQALHLTRQTTDIQGSLYVAPQLASIQPNSRAAIGPKRAQ